MIETENKKRIVTAVLMASAIAAAILFLEPTIFAIAIGLIAAVATWEWCHLGSGPASTVSNIVLIFVVGVGVPALSIFPPILPWVLGIALLWWISVAITIVLGGLRRQRPGWQTKKWHALITIFPAAVAITGLHATGFEGRWYVLACLLIVWTTDTCAYMVGRVCGKRLLAPKISPAKTIEGVCGGFVGALIVSLVLYETLPTEMTFSRLDWMVLTFLTAGFSVIGDLTESIYKRAAGIKDSGWILPGHGGILDRIDSTLAASPVFLVGLMFVTR